MARLLNVAVWAFFAAIIYLMFSESGWVHGLPVAGNITFTLIFVLFSILHCVAVEGGRRTAVFFAVSAIVSYLMEETGVRTGLVYGPYHYSDMLGAKLGHVPVIIPLAWFMMIYPSWVVARALLRGVRTNSLPGVTALAVVAALVMTAWDVVMDPGMSAHHNWIWENGGAYFGVPGRNYFGWLLTTFLVYWIVGWMWRRNLGAAVHARLFNALPVIVYAWYALRYISPSGLLPALRLIALFAMGAPALVALIQVFMAANK